MTHIGYARHVPEPNRTDMWTVGAVSRQCQTHGDGVLEARLGFRRVDCGDNYRVIALGKHCGDCACTHDDYVEFRFG